MIEHLHTPQRVHGTVADTVKLLKVKPQRRELNLDLVRSCRWNEERKRRILLYEWDYSYVKKCKYYCMAREIGEMENFISISVECPDRSGEIISAEYNEKLFGSFAEAFMWEWREILV